MVDHSVDFFRHLQPHILFFEFYSQRQVLETVFQENNL